MTKRLLNLGCGDRFHRDWVNIDMVGKSSVLGHDLRSGIPFADESFDVVYHSHVLEHIARHEAPQFLVECRRVLKCNGIFRVVVPDLELLANNYLKRLEDVRMGRDSGYVNYEWSSIHLLDQMVRTSSGGEMERFLTDRDDLDLDYIASTCGAEVANIAIRARAARSNTSVNSDNRKTLASGMRLNWIKSAFRKLLADGTYHKELEVAAFRSTGEVHQWMYDEISLATLLTECGFKNPDRKHANESAVENWNSFHLDVMDDGTIFHTDSLYMEACK